MSTAWRERAQMRILLWNVHPDLLLDAFVQYERWLIPALKPTAEHNVTGQVQLTFTPKWRIHAD